MAKLGVNIDHVATLRQARGTKYPDPLSAALIAEKGGADQITVHLREDRRHIQDFDVRLLRKTVQTELNLEMALSKEIVTFALDIKPNLVTLVPEKRKELTTEGGLDVKKHRKALADLVPSFQKAGIRVSLFINPDVEDVILSHELKVDAIEIHTGAYAEQNRDEDRARELERIRMAAKKGKELDLWVAAGHGLHYTNTQAVTQIKEIVEFNIGHSIIARAVFVGLEQAVREMKALLS
ncbi:MAG: pyridoxine 5'-phosphate synthase [Deltaproteobacteria bacterium]|nr:MAG: pyridoxine 5'-phosphate synthase [Deltaproteobacteria bacterium]